MLGWLRHHLHSCGDALKRLALTPLTTLLSVLVIGSAVTLPVSGYVAIENLRSLGTRFAGDPQLSVFMATDATRVDVARVEAMIRAVPIVERVEFVSKDTAFALLKKNNALSDVMATLKSNPLPDALVIHLGRYSAQEAESLSTEIKRDAKVSQVQLDAIWMRRLAGFLNIGRLVLTGLAIVLGIGLVAVTFNTVRLQILTRAQEIEISRLVGATDRFIRRPLFYYAAITGLLGSLLALGAVIGGLAILNHHLGPLAALYSTEFQLAPPRWPAIAMTLGVGILLSLAGAWAAHAATMSAANRLLRTRNEHLSEQPAH